MEDRGSPALEKDWKCPCRNPSSLASSEGPAVQTSPQLSKSMSSAHRHLSRRNGLSKLCQSRMTLSGDYLLVVIGHLVSVFDPLEGGTDNTEMGQLLEPGGEQRF